MKALLVHPEDDLPRTCGSGDLVIDLGRAPKSWYQRWKQSTEGEVFSLFDFTHEIEDLYLIRRLVQLGSNQLIDSGSIDWWNILSLELVPDLLRLSPAMRLAQRLGPRCELEATRGDMIAQAIAHLCGKELRVAEGTAGNWRRKVGRLRQAAFSLDAHQLLQVIEDKLGLNGLWQDRVRRKESDEPVILLPSAYHNASRTAVDFAAQLPERKFLLVYTRTSGKLADLPANVGAQSLAMISPARKHDDVPQLLKRWQSLRNYLVRQSKEWEVADAAGILDKMPSLLRWGTSYRNAWQQIFDNHNIAACLSTDDSNPPTRIPLDLAHAAGLPTVACHHGALDYFMAIKTVPLDACIAKSQLERDYMRALCQVPENKIAYGSGKAHGFETGDTVPIERRPWLVFFSEPYSAWGWRSDSIYSELLPQLHLLAKKLDLQLILKIHPFESVREHRRRLMRFLPQDANHVIIIPGPPTPELWQNTRLALTVQSTTALQCAELGIPVFFCGWLRDTHSGYQQQYVKFDIGEQLNAIEDIDEIPAKLNAHGRHTRNNPVWALLTAQELDELLLPAQVTHGEQFAMTHP
ncbi:MAG TPA: hypothetical protein VF753_00780 [Terriglobales bacterium]